MASESVVTARHTGGVRFEIDGEMGQHLAVDTAGNDAHDYTPMELLLGALAGCLGISVVPVLRKMRLDVTGYEIRVRGTKSEEHPRVFTDIAVEHTVRGPGLNREQVERAVTLAEERYCGVSAMLGRSAHVTHTIRVEEDA